ncbi:MAG: hypothetical protein ACWGON_12200, partial [Gemmatimonadota bacterium]
MRYGSRFASLRKLDRRFLFPAAAVAALLFSWLAWTWATWPDVEALQASNPETTAFIERYRQARRAAGESDAVRWSPVPYDEISTGLKRAVVASEDTE